MEEITALGLEVRRMLGSGSFAQVYHCYDHTEQCDYAVKIILKQAMKNSRVRAFVKEAEILAAIEHKNVIKFHKFQETEQYLLIKMELARGGTLKKLLEERKLRQQGFSEAEISLFLRNLLEGIRYLHSLNIIHRDLKPENILFDDERDLASLKIVDFGLSAKLEIHNPSNVKAQCGTLLYMAPEIFFRPSYTKSVDIWSCAIIMYNMFNEGAHPFYAPGMKVADFKMKLKHSEMPPIPHTLAQNFMNKISKREYEERYNVNEALKHPWITRNKDDEIPLSIHESYKGFDVTNNIIHMLKFYLTLGSLVPHHRIAIEQYYRFKVNDFNNHNETVRVMSPSRRKMRDKNNEIFAKMKQMFRHSIDSKESYTLSKSSLEDDSPTLKKHESYFQSLFQKDKEIDLAGMRQKGETKYLEEPATCRVDQGSPMDSFYFKLNTDRISSTHNELFKQEQPSSRLTLDPQIQLKLQNQIQESVNSLKQSARFSNTYKGRIFQRKSIGEEKESEKRKNFNIIKKYSHGLEMEKAEPIVKTDTNLSLSTKQIYNRRANSPAKMPTARPMLFSVMSKNSARK